MNMFCVCGIPSQQVELQLDLIMANLPAPVIAFKSSRQFPNRPRRETSLLSPEIKVILSQGTPAYSAVVQDDILVYHRRLNGNCLK